jgi:Tfp pilus assembly protein PilN
MNQEIQELLKQQQKLEQLKQEILYLSADIPKWDMMDGEDIKLPF